MNYPDYYALLGVSPTATRDQIQRAYREMVRRYHPDLHQDDRQAEERIKQINEAYAVLSDSARRSQYDQSLRGGRPWPLNPGPTRTPLSPDWAASAWGRATADSLDSSDLLGDFLRSASPQYDCTRASSPSGFPGQDLEMTLQITLEEAYSGKHCVVETGSGPVTIRIPSGIRDGGCIRLAGYGLPGLAGGQKGDLYIQVEILEHPRFRREADDLHLDLPLNLYTAVLGGSLTIPTLAGEIEATLPPGTQPGTTLRLRGYGMPLPQNPQQSGDLFVHLLVQVPTDLTKEEKRLFQRLRKMDDRQV